MRKLKSGKEGNELVIDWVWRLCNVAFESGALPKDCRKDVIVPLYKSKVGKI